MTLMNLLEIHINRLENELEGARTQLKNYAVEIASKDALIRNNKEEIEKLNLQIQELEKSL